MSTPRKSKASIRNEQWWLLDAAPGLLLWSRLTVREDGSAEVFDSTGLLSRFDDEAAARMFLLDQAFRAFDGLDDEDALELGFMLADIAPPQADDDRALLRRMTQRLAGRG